MKKHTFMTLAGGLLAGLIIGGSLVAWQAGTRKAASGDSVTAKTEIWTCSMHPQIRLNGPGNCPICEMPLIPAQAASGGTGGPPRLAFTDQALAMASVETAPVTRRELSRILHAVGKVEYNETSLATLTARVDGYAERLFVDFTGARIKTGDPLVEIYSPDLLIAQQELLIALRSGPGGQPQRLVEAARAKLQYLGLTTNQVATLAERNTLTDRVTLYAPVGGTVIEKTVVQKSAFKSGDALYRIANLDTVWVNIDIYEVDLPGVRLDQQVSLTTEAIPGRTFEGRITFIQPVVDESTRTIRVRVQVENKDQALKPGMFVSATITTPLVANATAPAAQAQGRWFCPMKCEGEKTYDQAGACPVCNMKLIPVPAAAPAGPGVLAVPAGAVLDSGTRRLVYVEKDRGLFEPRDVVLGPRSGDAFQVLKGLSEGERIVTRGGFLIDSQFQITGHPSLFYPGGLMGGTETPAAGEPEPEAPSTGAGQHKH